MPLTLLTFQRCMLSGGTGRRALPRYQSEEMTILNISFPLNGIEPQLASLLFLLLSLLQWHDCAPAPQWSQFNAHL